MFKDYKSVIIVILCFFLFRKANACPVTDHACECGNNDDDKKENDIIFNEYTERAFEQNPDLVRQYWENQ